MQPGIQSKTVCLQKTFTLTNGKILNAYKSQMLTLWFCFATIFFYFIIALKPFKIFVLT